MNWKDFWDCPEEIVICGICSSIFLYWIVGWWVLPITAINGFLWRYGGVENGLKMARWLGVPVVLCTATFLTLHHWAIFLAVPFMVYLSPFSYGKDGWLWKLLKNDLPVRLICFVWFWLVFVLAYSIPRI